MAYRTVCLLTLSGTMMSLVLFITDDSAAAHVQSQADGAHQAQGDRVRTLILQAD